MWADVPTTPIFSYVAAALGGHGGQVQRHPSHPRLRQVVGAQLRPAGEGAGVGLLEQVLGLGGLVPPRPFRSARSGSIVGG
jgi:hypothetical protein